MEIFSYLKISFYFSVHIEIIEALKSLEVNSATQVQILNEAACISSSINTREKSMNPTILPPVNSRED